MTSCASVFDYNPVPEDAGTVTFIYTVTKIFQCTDLRDEDIYEETVVETPTYLIASLEIIGVETEITETLMGSGIPYNDVCRTFLDTFRFLGEMTSDDDYRTDCALTMWLDFTVVFSPEEASHLLFNAYQNVIDEEAVLVEEVLQLSLGEAADNVKLRPVSKIVVGSLSRKVYNKTNDSVGEIIDKCTICLEEFKDGTSILTLPCGHEFDDECILEWFARSHVCPLCRFELPSEDDVREINN